MARGSEGVAVVGDRPMKPLSTGDKKVLGQKFVKKDDAIQPVVRYARNAQEACARAFVITTCFFPPFFSSLLLDA